MYPKPGKGHTHGGPSRSNYSILTRLRTHLSATRPTHNLILANPRPLCCYLLAINWYLNVASRWLPEHVVQCHNITRRHLSRLAGFTRKKGRNPYCVAIADTIREYARCCMVHREPDRSYSCREFRVQSSLRSVCVQHGLPLLITFHAVSRFPHESFFFGNALHYFK